MAQYDFNVNLSPSGVCPPKLARQLKRDLGLNKKPKITYVGTNFPGTDNLQSGEYTVKVRELTPAEQATMLATIQAHDPCKDVHSKNKPDAGYDLDDLDDMLSVSFPGQIIFVRDIPRLDGSGNGAVCYRDESVFRRCSNDALVYPEIPLP